MHVENLIVGGGPAGLQLGQHFAAASRDYLIVEAGSGPGTFFERFPRHRRLLSLNKRFNFYTSPSFNSRHDWNSLLSDRGGPQFPDYSEELYPDADDMVRYLRDYCEHHGLRIRCGTRVDSVRRQDGRFLVAVGDEAVTADRVFLATGPLAPRMPEVDGIELARSYADHTLDARAYRNRKVAIIGRGNSAFEVANHLAPEAAIVHLLVAKPVRLAWATHYPGDVRAINDTVLDMYHLKSLHATLSYEVRRIRRTGSGMLAVDIEEELPHWDPPVVQRRTIDYHDVICCTGWRFADPGLFGPECTPRTTAGGKYFELSPWWETSVPGIYCVGTSMQARDRQAASGFIHGFRYNVRSLFRWLEQEVYGVGYPRLILPLTDEATLTRAADVLLRRLSTSCGLYSQHGVLADVITVDAGRLTITPELPVAYALVAEELRSAEAFVTMTLEYGFDRYPAGISPLEFTRPNDPARPDCSAFLHPVFRTYRNGELVAEVHLSESLDLRWDAEAVHDTDDLGHRGKVMDVLNAVARISPKSFDTSYEGLRRRANLRPLEREVVTVAAGGAAVPDRPCSFPT
jgi:thioredoxin reductase